MRACGKQNVTSGRQPSQSSSPQIDACDTRKMQGNLKKLMLTSRLLRLCQEWGGWWTARGGRSRPAPSPPIPPGPSAPTPLPRGACKAIQDFGQSSSRLKQQKVLFVPPVHPLMKESKVEVGGGVAQA